MNPFPEPELVLQGGAPIVRQIQDQLRAWIVAGRLWPGEQLPTVRALAVGLAVNPQTVAQAYAELEREGLVSSAEGSGTFVAAPPVGPTAAERRARLEQWCTEFLSWAVSQGYTAHEVLDTAREITQRRYRS
jgi:GntR family transcriptional regulator